MSHVTVDMSSGSTLLHRVHTEFGSTDEESPPSPEAPTPSPSREEEPPRRSFLGEIIASLFNNVDDGYEYHFPNDVFGQAAELVQRFTGFYDASTNGTAFIEVIAEATYKDTSLEKETDEEEAKEIVAEKTEQTNRIHVHPDSPCAVFAARVETSDRFKRSEISVRDLSQSPNIDDAKIISRDLYLAHNLCESTIREVTEILESTAALKSEEKTRDNIQICIGMLDALFPRPKNTVVDV